MINHPGWPGTERFLGIQGFQCSSLKSPRQMVTLTAKSYVFNELTTNHNSACLEVMMLLWKGTGGQEQDKNSFSATLELDRAS